MSTDMSYINPDNLVYRKSIGLMILNADRHVLIGQRRDTGNLFFPPKAWQMPQGGIDGDETPWQAALREMKEEIGTTNVRLIAESREWYSYDFPEEIRTTLWGGRFFGQTQKWFLMAFLGHDTEINIHTRHPEFTAWRWVAPHHLPDLIVPFKHDLYLKVLKEFEAYL